MNYQKIYADLIYKRTVVEPLKKNGDGLIETHHIIPRSCGGTNARSNLVNLTLREHFIAHELLVFLYAGTKYQAKMAHAWEMMVQQMKRQNLRVSSRLYEKFRLIANRLLKGQIVVNDGKKNLRCFPDQIPEGFSPGQITNTFWITNGTEEKYLHFDEQIPSGWKKGRKPFSEYQLEILAKSCADSQWITNGSISKRLKNGKPMPKGFYFGVDPERLKILQKNSSSNKGKIKITDGKCNKYIFPTEKLPKGFQIGCKYNLIWITNGISEKRISKTEKIPNGWRRGKIHRKFINNGNEERALLLNELVPDGWKLGRLSKKK